jgi:hypothetical protein
VEIFFCCKFTSIGLFTKQFQINAPKIHIHCKRKNRISPALSFLWNLNLSYITRLFSIKQINFYRKQASRRAGRKTRSAKMLNLVCAWSQLLAAPRRIHHSLLLLLEKHERRIIYNIDKALQFVLSHQENMVAAIINQYGLFPSRNIYFL